MKKRTIIILVIVIVVGSIGFLPTYLRNRRINDLKEQGENLAQKVETYRATHHKLPAYLEDMRLNLPDDYPIYYAVTKDTNNYVIWFSTGIFKTKVYRSDSKSWADEH